MTPHWLQWIPFGLFVLALLGGVWAAFKIVFLLGKHFEHVDGRLNDLEKQFKPNGGSSLKDDVNKLKGDVRDVNTKLDTYFSIINPSQGGQ